MINKFLPLHQRYGFAFDGGRGALSAAFAEPINVQSAVFEFFELIIGHRTAGAIAAGKVHSGFNFSGFHRDTPYGITDIFGG